MKKMKNPEKRFDAFEALVEANFGKEDFPVVLGYVDETAVVRVEQLGCRTRNYAKVDPQTALDDLKNRSEIPALYEPEMLSRLLSD